MEKVSLAALKNSTLYLFIYLRDIVWILYCTGILDSSQLEYEPSRRGERKENIYSS